MSEEVVEVLVMGREEEGEEKKTAEEGEVEERER